MSDFFETARSPGVVGVVLGLVVLGGFGALGMAVFDGRLNGDNATKLKDEVREQSVAIFTLEADIERVEEELVAQKRNEAVAKKLAVATKTMELLEKRAAEFPPQIEKLKSEITQINDDQLAYRDETDFTNASERLEKAFQKSNSSTERPSRRRLLRKFLQIR
jgi:hypothetical protein